MEPLLIRVCRIGPVDTPLPKYETEAASGMDLRAALELPVTLEPMQRSLIGTGLRIAIPVGFEGQVRPRSGLALRNGIGIVNSPGTVDADYRGEIKVLLINLGHEPFVVRPLERIAQLVIQPVVRAQLILEGELDETVRGSGGYGSTGI